MSEVTKRALASSLRRLLMKEPLDKITIKELTDDCGISRSAFYYHFQDIYELVEWTTFEKLGRKLSKSVEEGNWKEIIRTIVTDFDEDRQFVLTVYHYINGSITFLMGFDPRSHKNLYRTPSLPEPRRNAW